jgi:hypothetical protein
VIPSTSRPSPYINQSTKRLLTTWLPIGVDHESGGIRPLVDRRAGQGRREHQVQRRAVQSVAGSNGWEMRGSLTKESRAQSRRRSASGFKAALALLEAGEVEALIFTKVDRESRYTENFARLIRLRGAGLAVDRRRDGHRHSYSDRQGDGALGGGLR